MSRAKASSFDLAPVGPFSLGASIRFVEGFAPAAIGKQAPNRLALAFCLEGSWSPVAVEVSQDGDRVVGRQVGDAPPETVADNLARILSLDVDGRAFAAIGQRDPVVRRLQHRYAGLRPVGFWSAYEAAVWTVLSQRMRLTQAAAVKQRIAQESGPSLDLGGQRLAAFPAPDRLASLDRIASVPAIKLERLHGVATAGRNGLLDSARLRAMNPPEAILELQQLPGIGLFSAELILVRGAMAPDVFPSAERRLHDSMRTGYKVPGASVEELAPDVGVGNPETRVNLRCRPSFSRSTRRGRRTARGGGRGICSFVARMGVDTD